MVKVMALDKSKFAESLATMPILELKALVDAMERVFGSVGSRVAAQSTNAPTVAVAEKTSFDVMFNAIPVEKKIAAIKVIREVLTLGLKEAKDFVDSLPKAVLEGASKEEAEKMKAKLLEIGATVEIV